MIRFDAVDCGRSSTPKSSSWSFSPGRGPVNSIAMSFSGSRPASLIMFSARSVIFTGSIFATLLTLFIVPVFYDLLARFTKSPEWTARQIEEYEAAEKNGEGQTSPA